ncbi:MAG: hypothetical protein A2293_14195 [Elusimicrobia bacterium RIFOXYB2_FULL_49_7]|nr:MAG: hypothetical protein A2293_14195 [Elusimicrobia bacterium RIFOXYB2_FULL_49_7]
MAKRTRRKRGSGEAKLNITSMMDMFTIILVFLLKSFSAQGQLVTPAKGLMMPNSTADSTAVQALDLEISTDHKAKKGKMERGKIVVEKKFIMYTTDISRSSSFLIEPLQVALEKYSQEAQNAAKVLGQDFKGDINIQADTSLPYDVLTKVMFTCGRAGFPNMQMLVYKIE